MIELVNDGGDGMIFVVYGDIIGGRFGVGGGVGNRNTDARGAEHTDVVVVISDGNCSFRIDGEQLAELVQRRTLVDAGRQDLKQRPLGADKVKAIGQRMRAQQLLQFEDTFLTVISEDDLADGTVDLNMDGFA